MLILHTPKEVLNKMLKCIFSFTNIIFIYLSKKSKSTKWGQQKNKPIKTWLYGKKITSNLLRENKILVSFTLI
jgi:hypothetical protein